jgi:hypothetical protein
MSGKFELITNDASVIQHFQSVASGVIIVDPASAILLGTSVGGQQSDDLMLEKKWSELKRLSDRLRQLNAHDAFYIHPAELFQSAETAIYSPLLAVFQQGCDHP